MSQSKIDEALDEVLGYVVRVGDATSQLINVAILLGDNANESVSGRSHRLKSKYKGWSVLNTTIDFVFIGSNHCERAYNNDVARAAKTLSEAKPKKKTTKKQRS
jgi:hypothetical protein